VRIGALPQHPRVLPPFGRHLHDSGQPLHARLRFCSVPKLNPRRQDTHLDPAEPANVARMAAEMGLRYVVITSVNRDDLEDGGSHHFAETVREVRRALPEARVEVLTPDFCGDWMRSRASSMPVRMFSITIWRPCRGYMDGCGRRRTTGSRSACCALRGLMRRRRC